MRSEISSGCGIDYIRRRKKVIYRVSAAVRLINPSVSYSGYYDTRNRKITLRKLDDTIYHELGHFVAFISGNTDQTAEFKAIYSQEKALYTAYNKSYVTQKSS